MASRPRSLSFLDRDQRVIGIIAILFVLGGAAFSLLLQGGFFARTYGVTARFTDAAGIQEGDNVTVAGLVAGRVRDVTVEDGQVVMDLAVQRDVALARDSRAEVVIETLLGRRSVALIAGQSAEPLGDGDVIPVERTTTPIDVTELNDISVDLLEASDAEALDELMRQITEVTAGKADEVQAMVSGLERVLSAVDSRREQLRSLIDSLRTLSRTLGRRDRTIVSLIDNLDVVLGNLAERQADLRGLLIATEAGATETAGLVRRNRGVLDTTLVNLHTDLQVIDRHQLDLAAAIAYLEQAVQGYSSVGYTHGRPNHWANIFVQSLGPVGVDALLGECGAVDQLFDHFFGTECGDGGGSSPPRSDAGAGGTTPSTAPAADEPEPAPQQPSSDPTPLPCTIEDLVGSVLAGTDGAAGGGCAR